MTLQEAIKHLKDDLLNNKSWCGSEECKKEHEQLLAFLDELNELRNEKKHRLAQYIRQLGYASNIANDFITYTICTGKGLDRSIDRQLFELHRYFVSYINQMEIEKIDDIDFRFNDKPDSEILKTLAEISSQCMIVVRNYYERNDGTLADFKAVWEIMNLFDTITERI